MHGLKVADEIVADIYSIYASLSFKPPERQYTILAAVILSSSQTGAVKTISLATGSKCLPAIRLSPRGDSVHDSHAEVLARRGAVRWLLEEVGRVVDIDSNASKRLESSWITRGSDGLFRLSDHVHVHLYISSIPCGDASTRFLATYQDEAMAALKDSSPLDPLPSNMVSRGRNGYQLYGVLRTKPGRADSPPTLSMSCSDKIAAWNVLGFQGALASRVFKSIFIEDMIMGDIPEEMQPVVLQECERAFWQRVLCSHDMSSVSRFCRPTIRFTILPFVHSRTSVPEARTSCNESVCWIADSAQPREILVNGLRRGVPPKHRYHEKFRPRLSKISMFHLYRRTAALLNLPTAELDGQTYFEAKQAITKYQSAKKHLVGEKGPLSGWIISGSKWESFYLNGECLPEYTRTDVADTPAS